MNKFLRKIVSLIILLVLIMNTAIDSKEVKAGVYWAKEAELIKIGEAVGYSRATYDGYINPYYFNVTETTDLSMTMSIIKLEVPFNIYLYNDDGDCLFGEYGIDEGDCKYNHSTGMYEISFNIGKLKQGIYYLELDTWNSNYYNIGAFILYKNAPISAPKVNGPKKTAKKQTTKKFKISKKSIVIKKGKKKSVTVTYKYSTGSVYYKITKRNRVSANWGNWKGDKVKLYIKGKRKGKTKIVITNSKNSKKLVIKVRVK